MLTAILYSKYFKEEKFIYFEISNKELDSITQQVKRDLFDKLPKMTDHGTKHVGRIKI